MHCKIDPGSSRTILSKSVSWTVNILLCKFIFVLKKLRLVKCVTVGLLLKIQALSLYTQSPIIRTSLIRTDAEFLGKFKHRALGSSNLSTTSKNLRTTRAQIFKAKNQVLLPFLICTYLSLVFIYFQCLLWKCIFHLCCSEQRQFRWLKFWFNMYSSTIRQNI